MASGGTILAIELADGLEAATRFCEACQLARIALSLGGPETLLTHPATVAGHMTPAERAEMGISDGMVRISVGLEHPADLIADLDQALARATG
jgi:O-succinylhomoserine sulfhydrylase